MKEKLILLLILIGAIFLFSKPQYQVEIKNKNYQTVATKTLYYDWSEITELDAAYSYSTLFYMKDTEVKILKEAGTVDWITIDKTIRVPNITRLTVGDELVLLITNCAINQDGEVLDVIIKINNIKKYSPNGYIYFNFFDSNLFFQSQNFPKDGYDYSQKLTVGDLIAFTLGSANANCDFVMTYYKHETYNETEDIGEFGNISEVNGFFYDIDIASNKYPDELFGSNEGFKPLVGSSSIYYNKNGIQPSSGNYEAYLQEIDNGISVKSGGEINPQGILYSTSAFMTTNNIENSTLKFTYAGTSCGIRYVFASPYPYSFDEPHKIVNASNVKKNDTFTYVISQYIPNNYYGTIMNFSEIYPNLYTIVILD